ncbi:hypothetical protein DAPPUDRAFT_313027 [Daphnia pulex]|uniref:Uncharacterized protein n=1 Tax=Daphnia pulex TaxID=6669 RepID=E9G1B4_DAPPU|nr:hypothetical protein DAPPUDRAFT_313027 [Daphnia pulex]|eukprot:EFX86666.1 hypothetical protein DAPPUDRAFT_313027 [Daphnia pulex]
MIAKSRLRVAQQTSIQHPVVLAGLLFISYAALLEWSKQLPDLNTSKIRQK